MPDMVLGGHHPWDTPNGAPARTWDAYDALQPDLVVIPSHAPEIDYQAIWDRYQPSLWVVRAKCGPNHLGYRRASRLRAWREWETEHSLDDAVLWLTNRGVTVHVQIDNEPDIELAREPVDDISNLRDAALWYGEWWWSQYQDLHAAYGDQVRVAPAPLSQGSPWRRDQWLALYQPVLQRADWLSVHCYVPTSDVDDADWGGEWRSYAQAWPEKPLIITETNDDGRMPADLRAAHLARYCARLRQCARQYPQLRGVALFILPGSAQEASQPDWWGLTPDTARAVRSLWDAAPSLPPIDPVPHPTPTDAPAPAPPVDDPAAGAAPWTTGHAIADQICAYADSYGLPRLALLTLCYGETGDLNPRSRRPADPAQDRAYWPDVSGGLCHQTVRWAAEYTGGGAYPGDATVAAILDRYADPDHALRVGGAALHGHLRALGWTPGDAVPDALVLDACCRYNWPAKDPRQNPNRVTYARGLDQARALLGDAPPRADAPPAFAPAYDPATPPIRQRYDYSCSAASLAWVLTALGTPTSEDAQIAAMQDAGLLSAADGLLVGTAEPWAAWLAGQGHQVVQRANASWSSIVADAARGPVLIGGHRWGPAGHWAACRAYDASRDALAVMTPTSPYQGIDDGVTVRDWVRLGPWSTVLFVVEDDMGRVADLEADVQRLQTYVGVLTGSQPGNVRAALIDAIARPRKTTKAAMIAQVQAAISTMERLGQEALTDG